jgi:hypothetical protein
MSDLSEPTLFDLVPERCRPCRALGRTITLMGYTGLSEAIRQASTQFLLDVEENCTGYEGECPDRNAIYPKTNELGQVVIELDTDLYDKGRTVQVCPYLREAPCR